MKRSTTERGYGHAHQQERKRLKPIVERGDAYCTQPVCVHTDRWIQPGTPWALGHTDDRTAYLGPVHADCNQLDGASKGGRVIAARKQHRGQTNEHPRPVNASRDW